MLPVLCTQSAALIELTLNYEISLTPRSLSLRPYVASEMNYKSMPAPLKSTFAQHHGHPFHHRDWVRVWVCIDIDIFVTHSFDPNATVDTDDYEEQIYYDWTRLSISGVYIRRTWRAPKKWRPVTNTGEEGEGNAHCT